MPEPTFRLLEAGAYDGLDAIIDSNNDDDALFFPPGMSAEHRAAATAAWAVPGAGARRYPAEPDSLRSARDLQRDATCGLTAASGVVAYRSER